jgi:16S rRNA (cytidine1402-2'-O)-methyltransferase
MMAEGKLVVCATPIGNLGDVTDRLRLALADADVIYAEDTRRTAKLLSHLGISTPTRSLFVGNERSRTDDLVRDVDHGLVVALVSDAGMPTVSDPGAAAVREVRRSGHAVVVVPGPSAVTTAIALAGFDDDRFVFEGFLPRKGEDRERRIDDVAGETRPVVLFASPKRLGVDLAELASRAPDREIAVIREMTKLHEEVWIGSVADAADHWGNLEVKGEITLVLGPGRPVIATVRDAMAAARAMIEEGESVSAAARRAASDSGVSRREVYQGLIDQDRN